MSQKIEINDNIVNNYWIKKHNSGIIELCINTVNRWINYHRFSNDEILLGSDIGTDDQYLLHIKNDIIDSIDKCICTVSQEKDQLSFYWIPYELIDDNYAKKKQKEAK